MFKADSVAPMSLDNSAEVPKTATPAEFVGNAACDGAKVILLNRRERTRAGEIARTMRHVELGSHPDFQNEFAMRMMFGEDV